MSLMEIPRVSKEKLKEIVRDFLANRILFSVQILDPSMVGMVFLPLALGAMSYDVPKPELPSEPVRPPKIGHLRPHQIENVTPPGLEASIREAEEKVRDAGFKLRWSEIPPDEFDKARHVLDEVKASREAALEAARKEADAKYQELLAAYRTELLTQRERVKTWRAEHRAWEAACLALDARVKEWETGRDAYHEKLNADLGVIYGYHKDAIGNRAINGYPMLSSCSMLHKDDWNIVKAAIIREQERDIDMGEDPSGSVVKEE